MPPIINSIVRWTARVGAILIAATLLTFALGEPAGPLSAIGLRDWAGMTLLFGAIAAMLLAWKWELTASLISLFALAAFAAVVHVRSYEVLILFAAPDILFLLDWKLRSIHPAPISKAS